MNRPGPTSDSRTAPAMRAGGVASCAFALMLCVVTARADEAPLDPAMPYRAERSSPVTYQVDFSVVVTAPNHTELLKVWLPLPQSDAGQEVAEGQLSTFPLEVTPQVGVEPLFGNRFACFEFEKPAGAQLIRHRFQVTVYELRWNLDAKNVERPKSWPKAFAPYLRSESQAVVVDDAVRGRLREIVPTPGAGFGDLSTVLSWVGRHFTYDHDRASLSASSLFALEHQRGHCSDYHGFCAAMGRALGYPTRVTYGINTFPKNSPSHCKLEAFLPPYGWVSFDVSETQKLVSAIGRDETLSDGDREQLTSAATARLLSGFRDNSWFVQTRGTDYELAPPASRRVSVVRTIYAEADGEPLPEPDPAAADRREFSWMTIHKYVADRDVTYPFQDYRSLKSESQSGQTTDGRNTR